MGLISDRKVEVYSVYIYIYNFHINISVLVRYRYISKDMFETLLDPKLNSGGLVIPKLNHMRWHSWMWDINGYHILLCIISWVWKDFKMFKMVVSSRSCLSVTLMFTRWRFKLTLAQFRPVNELVSCVMNRKNRWSWRENQCLPFLDQFEASDDWCLILRSDHSKKNNVWDWSKK